MTREDIAAARRARDAAELEEVRQNLRHFGEFAHPDDPPGRNLYLQQKFAGTGLTAFLREIEGKPEPTRPNLYLTGDDD